MRPVFTAQGTALARIPLGPAVPGAGPAGGLLREAVFLATRHLGPLAGEEREAGRPGPAWRGYELRLSGRATPHGVFSGVAVARFAGREPDLRLGSAHVARTVPSASWLAGLAGVLAQEPGVLPALVLVTSPLLARRGGRYYADRSGDGSGARPGSVSVRVTAVTSLVVSACAGGAPAHEVLGEIARRWPDASGHLPAQTLLCLIRSGVLLHDLVGWDPREDPLGRLLGVLPPGSRARPGLGRLRGLLADADRHPPAAPARLSALAAARDAADLLVTHDRPLRADTAADASITLPASLAAEAAEAAGVLWRVGWGSPPLEAWHEGFRERYGTRRWVPLLEATDPVTGLGMAEGAEGIGPAEPDPRREAALARLLAAAAADSRTEVVLSSADIADLACRDPWPPPRTAEVYVRVLAAAPDAPGAGRLGIAVCPGGGSQDAGSTAGRFAALLPLAAMVPEPDAGTAVAELAILPRTAEGASLAPPPGLARYRLPVGLPALDGDLRPADLLLGSSGSHLVIWSPHLGRPVVPVLYSRLAAGLIPPLARFLSLAGQGGARPWHGWSWRSAAPFTPAVRWRRTLLAPARWVLPPGLTAAAGSAASWDAAVARWRTETRPAPPQRVIAGDGDRQLPLDLGHEADRELLRRYVRRGVRAVTGPLAGPGMIQAVLPGPLGQHLLEVVVALRRAAPPLPARYPPPAPPRAAGDGLYLPGQEWLALTVPTSPTVQDAVLAELRSLAAAAARHCDRWFWLRYRDQAHGTHLRIRFHGRAEVLAARVLPPLSRWAQQLRASGLAPGFSIVSYERETERYGGGGAITAAEDVFCADSDLALEILAAVGGPQRILAAALSAAAITRALAGPGHEREAIGDRRLDRAGRALAQSLRPAARLADQQGTPPAFPAAVAGAWQRRERSLAAYRAVLGEAQRAACASDLIHLSCNRLVPGAERVARAIAADLLAVSPAPGPARAAP